MMVCWQALEAAGQVAGVSIASSPLPYSDVAMRCETFGTNAGRKIPVWMNLGGSGRMNGLRKVVLHIFNILLSIFCFLYVCIQKLFILVTYLYFY